MYPTRTSRKTIEFENRKSVKELKPKKHPKGTPSKAMVVPAMSATVVLKWIWSLVQASRMTTPCFCDIANSEVCLGCWEYYENCWTLFFFFLSCEMKLLWYILSNFDKNLVQFTDFTFVPLSPLNFQIYSIKIPLHLQRRT